MQSNIEKCPANKIFYWQGILDPQNLASDYGKTIKQLAEGNYQSLNLEKLRGHNVYSVRINNCNRLLFTTIIVNDKPWLMLLDEVLNHDYAKSRFLKPAVLKHYLELHGQPISEQLIHTHFEEHQQPNLCLPAPTTKKQVFEYSRIDFFHQKFIELDNLQLATVTNATLPLILSGAPGSGKSCIALMILGQYIEHHSQATSYPVLYVTESDNLATSMRRAWHALPLAQNAAANDVQFKSYEQLIKTLMPETENMTFVDKDHCIEWLEQYIKDNKKFAGMTKTDTPCDSFFADRTRIYQEFRIIAGCADFDAYQVLGQRQSLFHEQTEKNWLYTACKRYEKSLKNSNRIHAPLYPLSLKNQFKCIVVDESQDFSHRQLEILFNLASNQQICFCEDNRQSLSDYKSKIPFLKQLIKKNNLIPLNTSYRCSRSVINMANTLSELKSIATGDRQIEISVPPEKTHEGTVKWLNVPLTELELIALQHIAASPDCAIVTTSDYLLEAKQLFKTPLVFDAKQIKGLEYKYILGYRLFDDPLFREADKLIGEHSAEISKKFGHRAKKGQANEHINFAFNPPYTAFTRATHTLLIIQEDHHYLQNIIKKLLNALPVAQDEPLPSTPITSHDNTAVWLEQVKVQLEQGNIEIAKNIYIEKLHKTAEDFIVFKTYFLEPNADPSPISTTPIITSIQSTDSTEKMLVTTEKLRVPSERDKTIVYLNNVLQTVSVSSLDNLMQDPKAIDWLFNYPLSDEACLFTSLFYDGYNREKWIVCLLKYQTLILEGLTADALCRPRSKTAGALTNTSPFYWLALASVTDEETMDFLMHPKIAKLLTSRALSLPRTPKAGGEANISPLYILASGAAGRAGSKVLTTLLNNNPALANSINACALCLPLPVSAEKLHNTSALFMLALKPDGQKILHKLFTKNSKLAKSIKTEALCRAVPTLSRASPLDLLAPTTDGKAILKILFIHNPALPIELKQMAASKSSPSKAGLFSQPVISADEPPAKTTWCCCNLF